LHSSSAFSSRRPSADKEQNQEKVPREKKSQLTPIDIREEATTSEQKKNEPNKPKKNDSNEENKNMSDEQEVVIAKVENPAEETSKAVFTNLNLVPADYHVDESALNDNQTMITFIYRLLYFDVHENLFDQSDFFKIRPLPKNAKPKSFSWTLDHSIYILRNGFQYCSMESGKETSFNDIIHDVLAESGKSQIIIENMQANLMTSVLHYKSNSKTIAFFVKFANSEYSLTNFRFFNMLFSLVFNLIYPNIEEIISTPDLMSDSEYFLLHVSYVDKICQIFLKKDKFPDDKKKKLMKSAPNPNYPNLISFWDFASEMITMFNDMHKLFHETVKNVLLVIGTTDFQRISYDHYTYFMRTIDLEIKSKDLKNLWRKITIETGGEDVQYIQRNTLMKLICEDVEYAEKIFKLQIAATFPTNLSKSVDKQEPLYAYVRKRFTTFVPVLMKKISREMFKKVLPYYEKLRNAFINLDISTIFMFYRHILQMIDLLITQERPYIIINDDISAEQMQNVINEMIIREKITAGSVSITIEPDSEDI
jgi:hypothetical protein